jgi:plasmid stability protein
MLKTTVYLPAELKQRLERLAARRGESEAALIREAITRVVDEEAPPSPRLGLFASGDPTLAERVDEELAKGFGRDGL